MLCLLAGLGTHNVFDECPGSEPQPCARVQRMQKLKPPPPLVGAQDYQMFPLSKYVVGQNIALDAVPAYRASTPT